MLDGPTGAPLHTRSVKDAVAKAKMAGGSVIAWSSRDARQLQAACAQAGVPLTRVEDGFIRSAGLGASFVQPSSLAFDTRGIFYDSTQPSDLEIMLEQGEFPPELLERAARLREKLVAARTSKYNVAAERLGGFDAGGRPVILVPGQVEDDASIHKGSPAIKRNLDLLKAARARHPQAFLVYKPHPDVEAGLRNGKVDAAEASAFADRIVTHGAIIDLIEAADMIETMTSLAGFEALLRGRPVATHGQPFYAGWGLTEDLAPVARRTRRRSIDELVAAALILYPRYLDPVTRLRCTPELLVERLAEARGRQRSQLEALLRLAQSSAGRALHWVNVARRAARSCRSAFAIA
jgi:capsular polysaccharide export protein